MSSAADERVRRELAAALFTQATPASIGIGASFGALLFALLQGSFRTSPLLYAWLAVHLALTAGYAVHDVWYRRRPGLDVLAWSRKLSATFIASSALYGLAQLLFFDGSNLMATAFYVMFFAGIGVVCVVGFSASFRAFLAYAVLTSVPLVVQLWAVGTSAHRVLAISTIVYVTLTIVAARRLRDILVHAAELRFHNEDLAANKTRFLAAASHDLRQPLHALGLFVELVEARVAHDPELKGFVDRIQASSRSLESLLNALLDISRIDSHALKPQVRHFALATLFAQLEAEFGEVAERKGLKLIVAEPGLAVQSDPELLARVLRNLLSNAVRYTDLGEVVLEARRSDGGQVALVVRDTGRGVPPAEQERVFDEFYQLENSQRDREQGLGLGLSIVRGLCGLLGHSLTLVSEPQRPVGTEVRVEVPRGDEAQAVVKPAAQPAPGSFAGRLVLVIDDEREIRAGVAALLGSWQCETLCAGSLDEAARLLSDTKRLPDAVMCDDRLPQNVTGPHALEALERQLGARLPALFVTGDTSAERIRDMRATGRIVLFKPVLPGKLRATLSALLQPRQA